LCKQIQKTYDENRQTYGSPRIQADLAAKGYPVSRGRVVRLMAQLGISARSKRCFRVTTNSKHGLPVAENRLNPWLHGERTWPEVGGRHHLYPNPWGLALSGGHHRPVL